MCCRKNRTKANCAAPMATLTPTTLEAPYGPGPSKGPEFATPSFQRRRGGCCGGRRRRGGFGRRGGLFAMMFQSMKDRRDAGNTQRFENEPVTMMEPQKPRQVSEYGSAPEKSANETDGENEKEQEVEERKSHDVDEAGIFRASAPPPSYEMSERNANKY